jgi:hypothetical protein
VRSCYVRTHVSYNAGGISPQRPDFAGRGIGRATHLGVDRIYGDCFDIDLKVVWPRLRFGQTSIEQTFRILNGKRSFVADSFHNFLFRVQPKVFAAHNLPHVERDLSPTVVRRRGLHRPHIVFLAKSIRYTASVRH